MKFVEFDVERLDEIFEDVAALSHQLCSLFVSKSLMHVLIRSFEVWEEENEDFLGIS